MTSSPASSPDGLDLSLDDARWLASESGNRWLESCREQMAVRRSPSSGFLKRLRGEVGTERARLVLLQHELRARAALKFDGRRDAFRRRGLEQATDELLARYKALRFPKAQSLVDVCCGVGGDAIGLSGRGGLTLLDQESVAVAFARHNVSVYGGQLVDGCVGKAEDVQLEFSRAEAVHVDPDRRASGRRVSRYAQLAPGPEFLERLHAVCPNLALKLAPATTELPESWLEQGEREWIENRHECRQQMLWLGELARHPGCRVATILAAGKEPVRLVGPPDDAGDTFADALASAVGAYLYEPRPAVLAADLALFLAVELGLEPLTPRGGYLTGDQPLDHPLLQAFAVEEVVPLRKGKMKRLLAERGIGRLEIKQRGVSVDPDQLRKDLRLKGDREATLILTQRDLQNIGILARRIA